MTYNVISGTLNPTHFTSLATERLYLGEASTSTEDRRALTTDVNFSGRAENNAATESALRSNSSDWSLSLPSWLYDNDSFTDQSLLEELIKAHRPEMIPLPSPGKQNCN